MGKKLILVLALALLAALAPQVALAAPAAQEEVAGESNLPFLFSAFAVAWAGFFAYVIYLHQRSRALRREIEALRRERAEQKERSS